MRVALVGGADFETYCNLLGHGAPEVVLFADPVPGTDAVHVFTASRAHLADFLPRAMAAIRPDGMIWVSWPKKASKVPSDITEDTVREIALPLGLVDVKVCAVDAVRSGLKLVIRKELR